MSAVAELELLEREPELAALRPVLEAARAGAGGLVVVEGPPGIGKTRLLAEARSLAAAGGLRALWARGGEYEREFAWGVARQLFEPVLSRAGEDEREELLSGAAGLAAPLFDPARPVAAAEPDSSFASAHGLFWLLANLAAREPVLVAVDDLQWVDPPSLRWLAYLQRRLEGLPVALVVGLRPAEPEAAEPLVSAVVGDPERMLLRPRPLSAEATARYVAATMEREPEHAFALACRRASDGNPLLLRELVIALRADGVEPVAEQVGAVEAVGSQALAGRVRLRLAGLGAHAAGAAAAVAVLGDGTESRIALTLAGLDGEAAGEAVDKLVRADVLSRDSPPRGHEPTLAFAHPIVRAAIYGDLQADARARLHAEAARVLAAAGAEPVRVAAHLLHAPPAGDAWAAGALRRAAALALAEGAADGAAAYLRRARAEPPPAAERAAVLLELGVAELRSRPPGAIEPLEAALSAADGADLRAEISLELGRALAAIGHVQDGVEQLERALDDLRAGPELLARIEAELVGLSRMLPESYAHAAERLRRLQLPPHPDGRPPSAGEAMLLASLAAETTRALGSREEAVALARRALAGGRLLEERTSPAYSFAVQALAAADELGAAADCYEEAIADAQMRGAVSRFAIVCSLRAGVWMRMGALDEAEADARQALYVVETHGAWIARFFAAGFLSAALIERGELDDASAVLESVPTPGPAAGADFPMQPRESRAMLLVAQGRPGDGAAELLSLGHDMQEIGIRNPAVSSWRSRAALALLAAGEPERARAIAAEELALARRWGAPRALSTALRASGLAIGGAEGLGMLSEAAAVLERSPALLERAHALGALGAALRRAGKRVEAREPLRGAVELAQRCGAAPLAATVQAELIAAGAKPRRHALSGAESLTPSERRVAAMAADGLTNRDIAQALFVTPKTVEVHLSNAYRKLDIGSRTQLADALGR
jgi:DNA-binding CsgD family transcriptional regulator